MRFVVRSLVLSLTLFSLAVGGCASAPPTRVEMAAVGEFGPSSEGMVSDEQLAERLLECVAEIRNLSHRPQRNPDFLWPREYDCLENALDDYLRHRRVLRALTFSAEQDEATRSLALQRLAACDLQFASLAADDAVLWRALNQAFHRSGIPAHSGEQIVHELTAMQLDDLPAETRAGIERLVRSRSWLLPGVENRWRHAPPAQLLASSGKQVSTQLRRGRGALIAGTGRMKNPSVGSLHFTPQQREQIRAALQPGDVLLTYSSGYVSNLFIPGNFKHAVTFVGTAAERRRAGLPEELLLANAGSRRARIATPLQQATLASGEEVDAVESLAEGVLLNNFDRILTTRINRLVVLRPRLHPQERAEQITDVFAYVGDEYDFSFDFTNASDQVCTEVVYRSLQGRGRIEFPLTQHAGKYSLTADELLRYALTEGSDQFECILAVSEAVENPGHAQVRYAGEAHNFLTQLPGLLR